MVDIKDRKTRFRIVGEFIRKKRQESKLSQKTLGLLFEPPVTTQFISNVERGVTPLPPAHVPMICRALKIKEEELMKHLEKEYTLKLSGRLGIDAAQMIAPGIAGQGNSGLEASYFQKIQESYNRADLSTRTQFEADVIRLLNVRRN